MDADAGAQVAAPLSFLRKPLFPGAPSPAAKKRHSPQDSATSDKYQVRGHQFKMVSASGSRKGDWNSRMWEWDSVMFVAKPSSHAAAASNKMEDFNTSADGFAEERQSLSLEIEKGPPPIVMDDQLVRPHKKARSDSPGIGVGNYPVCQVDDCKVDLSKAKDYHKRHKVCNVHSKSAKALVANQMQRFCQQCSRFHSLSEFDEGKRSCRRRLAGHNHRRRKIQPDDAPSHPFPNEQGSLHKKNMEIVNLISILSSMQGSNVDHATTISAVADGIQQTQVYNKIKLAPAINSIARLNYSREFDLKMSDHQQSVIHRTLEKGSSSTQTLDLLGVLSAALDASESDDITPQGSSSRSSDGNRLRDYIGPPISDFPSELALTHPHTEIESGIPDQASSEAVRQSPLMSRSTLPLQLFSSDEDNNYLNVLSSRKYLRPQSSVPLDVMPPSSSPLAQKLFPFHSATEILNNGDISVVPASTNHRCSSYLSLWNN